MMRALWTGASGMKAQQTNVDTIANNIANVNTVGYKSQSTQFKTLLYQTLRTATTTANGEDKPTSAQVGLGTRVASTNTDFTQGTMQASSSPTALCVSAGDGFFAVRGGNNDTYYTRNGDFTWSLDNNGNRVLTTSQGYDVLDYDGNPIYLPDGASGDSVSFGTDGSVAYRQEDGTYVQTGQSVALYQFNNTTGLVKSGETMFQASDASGAPISERDGAGITRSTIAQGYLEASNVDVADEMVNLIIAQRAYELNSKAITTSDTMLEQANNLKR
jgi:flagellar basal-body rod protein FlgG